MDTLTIADMIDRPPDLCLADDPPLFQNRWEFACLTALYRLRRPRAVLEIGTFYGGSLQTWLSETPNGATIVSIDVPQAGASNPARWQAWAEARGQTLHLIAGDSRDRASQAQAQGYAPYDWLFIDGDHRYEYVYADWGCYSPFVAPGGVVVFHDINERPGYGVSSLWRSIQGMGYITQEINAHAPELCGIGVVYL